MNLETPFSQMIPLVMVPAGLLSFVLCGLMRSVSPRLGYVDRPAGRKAHGRIVPLGGGIGVYLTFSLLILAGIAAILVTRSNWLNVGWLEIHEPGIRLRIDQIGGVLLGGLILVVLGLFDDVKDLGPGSKLTVQFAVAALVVIGFDVRLYLFIQGTSIGWILSIFWIVILINSFNFLDNADGLSAGVALICSLVLLGVAIAGGQVLVGAFLACFAGTLVGFLLHNFPPAKLFLGDAGSMVIGYLLAVGAILTTYYNESNPATSKFAVFIPVIVMAIPLYDFFSVIFLRWRSGVSPFIGDHRHFSHRLMRRGLSPRQTIGTIYLATAGTAVGAIMLRYLAGLPALLIFLQTLCIVAIIGILEYQPTNHEENSR